MYSPIRGNNKRGSTLMIYWHIYTSLHESFVYSWNLWLLSILLEIYELRSVPKELLQRIDRFGSIPSRFSAPRCSHLHSSEKFELWRVLHISRSMEIWPISGTFLLRGDWAQGCCRRCRFHSCELRSAFVVIKGAPFVHEFFLWLGLVG